ncbi:hypothetical protein QFZ28_000707 [Neobacillus niacini]|uniref:hypothetical protein n=1 Tax=Neobacillus niacini TaxID=86668 RepID=UPI00278ABE64|nr:hypothetical protein [Neobacillus niacini]MDQ1000307.1 hypothetical protein [Neobacillus niacini]
MNKDNIAESITINNIDINGDQWEDLKGYASLISKDSNYYYFNTDEYEIVIDIINMEATISLKM